MPAADCGGHTVISLWRPYDATGFFYVYIR